MFKQITVDEAKQKLDAAQAIVVDIRDITSYERGHIDGAEHLTAENFAEFCDKIDSTTPIIVYCYHGVSSQTAAQYLAEEGFHEVYSIMGGFEAWRGKYSCETA